MSMRGPVARLVAVAARRRLESAEPLLMDFVRDQAEICTVYGDCETTDLIRHGTPIGGMTISVASLLLVEDGGTSMLLSFWSDPSLIRDLYRDV